MPAAVFGTLAIGVIGGALIGYWMRHEPETLASAPQIGAAVVPLPPEPPIETVARILPSPVLQLSSVPAVEPGRLIAHLIAWRGAAEPSPEEIKGFLALTQCPAFKSATPTQHEALSAAARAKLTALSGGRRARISVSLPPAADGALSLPTLAEPMRLRVAAAIPPACAELYAASGQPQFFDLRVTGPAPWPARPPAPASGSPAGSLFADLVVDLADPSALNGAAGVAIVAQAVALYVWTDADRRAPVAALGHAAPESQDAPPPPIAEAPPEVAPLAGRPVSADLARRASQTSGVALPPITTAPRQSVETQSLPPPLISR
ncbi:MAG: hypothetical protein ACOVVK_23860 [Elsteraceae bacterium]